MKKEERKQRFALTLLFSGVVFCFFIATMTIIGGVIIFLVHKGVVASENIVLKTDYFVLNVAVWSVLFGTVLTAITSRIPLKPVNKIINAMNRLASGDYKPRLNFSTPLGRHSTAVELTDSFNRLAEELEHTEMLRSDFINNFSHEFKTPIVSIAGFAKLLKRGNLTEEQRAEYIDIIEEESLRLSYMATNVLNLTKVENQAILTDVTRFNLSEQIRNCALLLENKWMKKNVELNIDFNEYYIDANEEMLKQVWINLIDNAVKFASEGGFVEVDITETEGLLLISVMNTGSEIPKEIRERIFNKFYQADESHATEGNGIGLAIVKQIVRLHRGYINVSSGNGKTIFTVALPKEK